MPAPQAHAEWLALSTPGERRHQARPRALPGGSARDSCRPTPSSATGRAISRAGGTATGVMKASPRSSPRPPGRWAMACPAAVAAKLRLPDRTVLAVAGDGDFLMNGQELATAAQYGIDLLVIVVDNSAYGTIRMHQEREFPGRISATELANPDFAALGRAFGGWAARVETTDEFDAGPGRGAGAQGPAPAASGYRHRAGSTPPVRPSARLRKATLIRKGRPFRTALSLHLTSWLRSCRRARLRPCP